MRDAENSGRRFPLGESASIRYVGRKMNNTTRTFLLSLSSLLLVSIANGAAIPAVDLTVTDGAGKVAHKGKTNANGSFSTGNLGPGNYVVDFSSKDGAIKGSKYTIAVTAGKNSYSAEAVAGEKIAGNGVAMKVVLATGAKITGQLAKAGSAPAIAAAASANAGKPETRPTKMINGKKHVWVRPGSGLEGGHWEEEGAADQSQAGSAKPASTARPASGKSY